MNRALSDLVIAGLAIAIAAGYLLATYNMRTLAIADPLGPKAFPAFLGVLMLLCGVSLIVTSLQQYRQANEVSKDQSDSGKSHPIAVGAVSFWLLGYYLVFEDLGFVLATILFLFGIVAFFNRGQWLTNALVAILFPVVLDFILSHALGLVPAPGLFSL